MFIHNRSIINFAYLRVGVVPIWGHMIYNSSHVCVSYVSLVVFLEFGFNCITTRNQYTNKPSDKMSYILDYQFGHATNIQLRG